MGKSKSKLEIARNNAQLAVAETNVKIENLGTNTNELYETLNRIQDTFDKIRNIPNKEKIEYEKIKNIRLSWSKQVEKIENDYKKAKISTTGNCATGVGTGVAVITLGPTVAMGIATTFGVASTGTAISTLSGAAATNAALAWLGGGAIAAGGGGMAAGNIILGLAGPIGWTIAGVTVILTGAITWKNISDKKTLENIFATISERDIKSYKLAIVELNERISRIQDECKKLKKACTDISNFGLDYERMTEQQQFSLGAYVNLMSSSTQLLVNPILGLQPNYTEKDFESYFSKEKSEDKAKLNKNLIIYLSNLLYKIELNNDEKKILYKSFKNNKEFLKSFNYNKKDFNFETFELVFEGLNYKYNNK